MSQPSYAKAMAQTVAATPLATWQIYLRAHLIDSFASVLPQPVRDASFEFRGKALNGLLAKSPRWQSATGALDGPGVQTACLGQACEVPTQNRLSRPLARLFQT